MKNLVKDGSSVTLTATKALASGQACVIGAIFGLALKACALGDRIDFKYKGEVTYARATGTATTEGQALYYDAANDKVTTVAAGNRKIGASTVANAAGDDTATVLLDGVSV